MGKKVTDILHNINPDTWKERDTIRNQEKMVEAENEKIQNDIQEVEMHIDLLSSLLKERGSLNSQMAMRNGM